MEAFNDCVREVELVDHPHTGNLYTWNKNWKDNRMLRVLDKVLCNHKWMYRFRAAQVDIPVVSESDHYSLSITVVPEFELEARPFKYQSFWSKHTLSQGIVKDCWDTERIGNNLNIEYKRLCDAERQLYLSKSRIKWYKEGDANTSFFHKSMRVHQAKNRITQMYDKNGILVQNYDEVKTIVVDYYKEFFAAQVNIFSDREQVKSILQKTRSQTQVAAICSKVTTIEVVKVMLSIKIGKTPGPDGFSAEFYKDT
ncbi:hypothetical protein LIER_41545 [Lithospermum erythrorhizon]|uniref:Uncharacterized protein n=1 Tax=Lithospermum erythrorhizon TaxID=34254 RepID=A0AAV3RCF9_LITER